MTFEMNKEIYLSEKTPEVQSSIDERKNKFLKFKSVQEREPMSVDTSVKKVKMT